MMKFRRKNRQELLIENRIGKCRIYAIGGIVPGMLPELDDIIEFSLQDNGLDIPDYYKAKIFRTIFTTKTTGFGMGLGMINDRLLAHWGEFYVVSKEGLGDRFII